MQISPWTKTIAFSFTLPPSVLIIAAYIEKSLRFSATSCCRRVGEWRFSFSHGRTWLSQYHNSNAKSEEENWTRAATTPRLYLDKSAFLSQNSTATQGCCFCLGSCSLKFCRDTSLGVAQIQRPWDGWLIFVYCLITIHPYCCQHVHTKKVTNLFPAYTICIYARAKRTKGKYMPFVLRLAKCVNMEVRF